MDLYPALKFIHVLSAAVLFGTGLGIAFFMVWAHRSGRPLAIAEVSRMVVTADFVFTATAVVIQPVTGFALVLLQGYDPFEPWLVAAYGLYLLTGACWLPVVAIQMRMSRLASQAASAGAPLPPAYHRLYRLWFALGWPAFAAVVGLYIVMMFKPVF